MEFHNVLTFFTLITIGNHNEHEKQEELLADTATTTIYYNYTKQLHVFKINSVFI